MAKESRAFIALAGDDPDSPPEIRSEGVVIGTLCRVLDCDSVVVGYRSASGPVSARARSMIDLGPSDIGREVALLFEQGNPRKPVILGLLATEGRAARSGRAPDPARGPAACPRI